MEYQIPANPGWRRPGFADCIVVCERSRDGLDSYESPHTHRLCFESPVICPTMSTRLDINPIDNN